MPYRDWQFCQVMENTLSPTCTVHIKKVSVLFALHDNELKMVIETESEWYLTVTTSAIQVIMG